MDDPVVGGDEQADVVAGGAPRLCRRGREPLRRSGEPGGGALGEVGRRSGFAASALRFYESRGLVEAERSAGGQRRYERSVLRRLAFIRAAGNVGLSLEEIRVELGRLPSARTPTAKDWQTITTSWRARLDEQIAALEDLRDGLDSCIGYGCLSLERCAISNPRDEASARGPGAVYLAPTLRRPPGGRAGR